jgi:small subunit ribosomal protein S11
MGKKRVAQKTDEEILKESKAVEGAVVTKSSKKGKKQYDKGKIYIQAGYNNTIITVTDESGNVIVWVSSGSVGFSGPKKSTPFAATKVAAAIVEKIDKSGPHTVDIFVKGVGSGRDSALRSLAQGGISVTSIKDITPIPHNGPRAPKKRRV